MAQAFGWRLAFVAAGLPGLVLALILFRTVPEPARTAAGEDDSTPPFRAVLRRLGKSPAFLNLTFGRGLVGLVGFGLNLFLLLFLVRRHGMVMTKAGFIRSERRPGGER